MKLGLKRGAVILTVLLAAYSLAACGNNSGSKETAGSSPSDTAQGGDASAAASANKPKEVKTLKLTMYSDWYLQGWQAIEQDINANADKLGFKLDIDKIAGGDQGTQILQARAATNDLPDLIAYPGATALMNNLHLQDKLIDFTGAKWTQNYDEGVLKGNFAYDGKIYGVPLGGSNIPGVFYNKKVFSDLGIAVPTTWEEFLAACDKVKAAGKTAFFLAGKDTWTVQIFNIMGLQREFKGKDPSQVMNDINTNKLNVKDLALLKDSYAKLKELKDKGYVQKNWLSDTYDAQQKAIADGTAAMTVNATWMLDEIKKKFPDQIDDIGAFTLPFDGDDPVGAWPPNALFGINTSSENQDAIKAFMDYFGSVETQSKYFAAQPGIPIIKGLNVDGIAPAAQDLYQQFTTPGRGQTNWQTFVEVGVGDFTKYSMDVLVGGKTPEQTLEEMRKEMEKDAKTRNLKDWQS